MKHEDVSRFKTTFLVVKDEERCSGVCFEMLNVSIDENRTLETRGELNPLTPPERKWESITMDFVIALPRTPSGHEVVWVIVDKLTKLAQFIPLRVGFSLEKIIEIYIKEIV